MGCSSEEVFQRQNGTLWVLRHQNVGLTLSLRRHEGDQRVQSRRLREHSGDCWPGRCCVADRGFGRVWIIGAFYYTNGHHLKNCLC